MYDIIYVPFHCLNFGLYLARFPVCYKEHLLGEIKYINKSFLKSNYLFKLHMCRCSLSTVGWDHCMTESSILWRDFFSFLRPKLFGRYSSVTEMVLVSKIISSKSYLPMCTAWAPDDTYYIPDFMEKWGLWWHYS